MTKKMSTANKGARLERFVINEFTANDPELREGIKSAASQTEIDIVLFDIRNKKIIIGQAKNWKRNLGNKARENIIKNLKKFEGVYTVEAKFFGKEEMHAKDSIG